MTVGIYGGTFDPIHFGHLNIAMEMMEIHHLAEVWFCPVWISPHKQEQAPTPVEQRLEMLRLALEDVPNCKITDVEAKRQGPSYTIDTLQALAAEEAKRSSNKKFCLILGEDAVRNFCKWHQPEEIVKQVPLYVGRRLSVEVGELEPSGEPSVVKALRSGMTNTKIMEISGTTIRDRISKGLYCGHLVPAKVLDYIYAHGLYLKN